MLCLLSDLCCMFVFSWFELRFFFSVHQPRFKSHHHHGPPSKRNPGFLQLPCGQLARLTIPAAVHPGGGNNLRNCQLHCECSTVAKQSVFSVLEYQLYSIWIVHVMLV